MRKQSKKVACFAIFPLRGIQHLQRRYFPHHLDDAEAAEPPAPDVHRILGQAAKDVLQVRTHMSGAQLPLGTHKHMAPDPASCALNVAACQVACWALRGSCWHLVSFSVPLAAPPSSGEGDAYLSVFEMMLY